MPHPFQTRRLNFYSRSFWLFFQPALDAISNILPLESRGDRPLKMTFEDQLKMLVFFHLEEHVPARHMLQVFEQDDFACQNAAPENGIKKSGFFNAISTRGIEKPRVTAIYPEIAENPLNATVVRRIDRCFLSPDKSCNFIFHAKVPKRNAQSHIIRFIFNICLKCLEMDPIDNPENKVIFNQWSYIAPERELLFTLGSSRQEGGMQREFDYCRRKSKGRRTIGMLSPQRLCCCLMRSGAYKLGIARVIGDRGG